MSQEQNDSDDDAASIPKAMLSRVWTAIVALLIGYAILFVRSKLHRKGSTDLQSAEKGATEPTQPAAVVEAPKADPIPLPAFPFEETHEVPIPGSELRYCRPFGPADTIAGVWCKLQTFTSTQPIVVRLGSPDSAPLFKSHFSPDGVVHSTGAMFAEEFARGILKKGWPAICRQVRPLSSFGVPADTPEGKYYIYTGALVVELKEMQLSGEPFRVRATFELDFRLVIGRFSTGTDYLHCAVPSGETEGGGMVVGFPWTLSRLTLNSDDRNPTSSVPEFVRALKTGYEKYALSDPSLTSEVISDGAVAISISEDTASDSDNKSLQITYAPVPHGPLDGRSTADQEFVEFAKAVTERSAGVIPAEGVVIAG